MELHKQLGCWLRSNHAFKECLPISPSASGAPSFLTVAEVAAMLRVSEMTVYRMVHSGDLPQVMYAEFRAHLAS